MWYLITPTHESVICASCQQMTVLRLWRRVLQIIPHARNFGRSRGSQPNTSVALRHRRRQMIGVCVTLSLTLRAPRQLQYEPQLQGCEGLVGRANDDRLHCLQSNMPLVRIPLENSSIPNLDLNHWARACGSNEHWWCIFWIIIIKSTGREPASRVPFKIICTGQVQAANAVHSHSLIAHSSIGTTALPHMLTLINRLRHLNFSKAWHCHENYQNKG